MGCYIRHDSQSTGDSSWRVAIHISTAYAVPHNQHATHIHLSDTSRIRRAPVYLVVLFRPLLSLHPWNRFLASTLLELWCVRPRQPMPSVAYATARSYLLPRSLSMLFPVLVLLIHLVFENRVRRGREFRHVSTQRLRSRASRFDPSKNVLVRVETSVPYLLPILSRLLAGLYLRFSLPRPLPPFEPSPRLRVIAQS